MYVIAPVDNGSREVKGRLNLKHNPVIKMGEYVKYRSKYYKIIAIVHEDVRTVLYVQESTLEAALAE